MVKKVFRCMVIICCENIFSLKMFKNNIFYFIKLIFNIKTINKLLINK